MSTSNATVLAGLQRLANPTNVAGMTRFGIVGKRLLGISVAQLRAMAKRIGRDHELAVAWSGRREELVKRAGFTMMATLAVHDKAAGNEVFRRYLGRVQEESTDERHNVKKGVNWALRQTGKRNRVLNREAIRTARLIRKQDSKAARWIASDALRELERWKPR